MTYFNGCRVHVCTACNTVSEWSRSWEWYGSEKDIEDGYTIVKTCSAACRLKLSNEPNEFITKRVSL